MQIDRPNGILQSSGENTMGSTPARHNTALGSEEAARRSLGDECEFFIRQALSVEHGQIERKDISIEALKADNFDTPQAVRQAAERILRFGI